jgi:hypothetical protein
LRLKNKKRRKWAGSVEGRERERKRLDKRKVELGILKL